MLPGAEAATEADLLLRPCGVDVDPSPFTLASTHWAVLSTNYMLGTGLVPWVLRSQDVMGLVLGSSQSSTRLSFLSLPSFSDQRPAAPCLWERC